MSDLLTFLYKQERLDDDYIIETSDDIGRFFTWLHEKNFVNVKWLKIKLGIMETEWLTPFSLKYKIYKDLLRVFSIDDILYSMSGYYDYGYLEHFLNIKPIEYYQSMIKDCLWYFPIEYVSWNKLYFEICKFKIPDENETYGDNQYYNEAIKLREYISNPMSTGEDYSDFINEYSNGKVTGTELYGRDYDIYTIRKFGGVSPHKALEEALQLMEIMCISLTRSLEYFIFTDGYSDVLFRYIDSIIKKVMTIILLSGVEDDIDKDTLFGDFFKGNILNYKNGNSNRIMFICNDVNSLSFPRYKYCGDNFVSTVKNICTLSSSILVYNMNVEIHGIEDLYINTSNKNPEQIELLLDRAIFAEAMFSTASRNTLPIFFDVDIIKVMSFSSYSIQSITKDTTENIFNKAFLAFIGKELQSNSYLSPIDNTLNTINKISDYFGFPKLESLSDEMEHCVSIMLDNYGKSIVIKVLIRKYIFECLIKEKEKDYE